MNIYYVYKHTFNNGTVYFGKGSKNRINSNKRNRYWMTLYNKYGEPKREYLNINVSEKLAFTLEQAYIFTAAQLNIKTCNISSGGEASASGHKHTSKAKAAISKKLTGVKKSVTTKEKMSIAQKKRVKKRDKTTSFLYKSYSCNRKAIVQLDKNGQVLRTFTSATEANANTGVNIGNIISVCKNNLKSAGGFRWQYL